MKLRLTSWLAMLLGLLLALNLSACDEQQKANQQKRQTKTDGGGGDDDDGNDDDGSTGDDGGDGDTGGDDDGGDDGGPTFTDDEKAVFDLWCEKAGETSIAKGELKKYYEYLCDGGKPTKLFEKTLIGKAYKGSGDPNLHFIEEIKHGAEYKTSLTVGVAIKIPITIKKHFDEVGPKNGDAEAQKKLAEKQDGVKATVEILDSYESTKGKHHVRGWKLHTVTEKTIIIKPIRTDAESEADHWMIEDGKAYMYTSYLTKANEGVFENNMLTAGIQVGDDAYLINVSNAVVDRQMDVFKGEAEKQIIGVAEALVKGMYEAAEEAK